MTQIIKFTNIMGTDEIFPPEPASKNIPDWYKQLESYIGGEKAPDGSGGTKATIKKCMPVFDSISSGYIIKSPVDVYVSQQEAKYQDGNHLDATGEDRPLSQENIENQKLPKTIPYYEWANFGILQFHPIEQAPNYPDRNGHQVSYPKWINPWAIKTPPGYSVLFIPPMHRESVFNILPGVVDTDTYEASVNFPFVLKNVAWEGLIPAGTPIAQVIPFKRDEWRMEFGTEQDYQKQSKISLKLRTRFFDSYKNQFRQPKEYR